MEKFKDFLLNKQTIERIELNYQGILGEYRKLDNDMNEYFKNYDMKIYDMTLKYLNCWINSESLEDKMFLADQFRLNIYDLGDKVTVIFFCYLFDITFRSCEKSYYVKLTNLNQNIQMICSFIINLIILNNHQLKIIDKLFTSLIIVVNFYDKTKIQIRN